MNRLKLLLALGMTLLGHEARADGYIGTYTERAGMPTGSAGIYHFAWRQGQMREITITGSVANPSYLALHPNHQTLYAVNEGAESRIGAYTVKAHGALSELNSVSAQGRGPCHLALDAAGHTLFVANYGSGSLVVIPVAADGSLREASQVIEHREDSARVPHAHQTVLSPDGRYVLSVDLGLDKIFVYRFDAAAGSLTPNDPAAFDAPRGSGPRHLAFSKNGAKVYLLTELSAELMTLDWDAVHGSLRQRSVQSILPSDYTGPKSGAEIALHPSGRWLYASSRGTADSIAIFALDKDGAPRLLAQQPAGGRTPRFIGLDPAGRFLLAANQGADAITVFRVARTGLLELPREIAVPSPVDIAWR